VEKETGRRNWKREKQESGKESKVEIEKGRSK